MRRLVLILFLAVLAGVSAAALGASVMHTRTASSGATAATLTWRTNGSSAALMPYSDVRLAIRRGGSVLLDRRVDALLCGTLCWPGFATGAATLAVRDVERDGSPDVMVSLFSGGAHCCYIEQVYRYDPGTQTYAVVQRLFGDPPARLATIAGASVFVSADDRFAYRFAAFAFSGLPIQIWSIASGRFLDVTRRYPAHVAADAKRWWKLFRANIRQHLGDGALAAWAADEELLGRGAAMRRTLTAQERLGTLGNDGGGPGGAAFIRALERFLARTGYS